MGNRRKGSLKIKKDGSWVSSVPPAKGQECQNSFSDCACGAATKKCTDFITWQTWCRPIGLGDCPVKCTHAQQMCSVANYNDQSVMTSMIRLGRNGYQTYSHLDGPLISSLISRRSISRASTISTPSSSYHKPRSVRSWSIS